MCLSLCNLCVFKEDIINVDLHCGGRVPGEANRMLVSKTLPQDVAFLVFVLLKSAPGSKARADHLGVATSIPINLNHCKYKLLCTFSHIQVTVVS